MLVVANAVSLHGGREPLVARHAILQSLTTPDFRDVTADFIDTWHNHAANVGAEAVAVALVRFHHQYGVGSTCDWWETTKASGTAF